MKKYNIFFRVKLYEDGEEREYYGFYPTNNYAEAANYIEEFFGNELVEMRLELLGTSLITMDEDTARSILHQNF